MDAILQQFFNFDIMRQAAPLILGQFGMTLLVCLAVVPLGLAGGLIVALASQPARSVRFPSSRWSTFFAPSRRSSFLIFVHAGLPFAGLRLSPFASVCGCVLSQQLRLLRRDLSRRPRQRQSHGQWEAARSTELHRLAGDDPCRHPQAVRNVLPGSSSNTVEVVKADLARQRRRPAGNAVPPTWRARSPTTRPRSFLPPPFISCCSGRSSG